MERAIGAVYRPQTEIQSHYFHASLPVQFGELIWFDESRTVEPLLVQDAERRPPPLGKMEGDILNQVNAALDRIVMERSGRLSCAASSGRTTISA